MKIAELCLFEAREDYIAQQQGEKIMMAYKNDTGKKPKFTEPLQVIKAISAIAPQNNQWLANLYIKGAFKLEDVNQIKQHIDKFNQIRNKLEPQQRDLGKYSLPQLYAVTRSFEEKQQQDAATHKAKGEEFIKNKQGEIIYKKGNVSVLIPHTKECSKFFGANTEWCTAHQDEAYNRFDYYNETGTLYIITANDGSLYQAHIGPEDDNHEYEYEDDGEYDDDDDGSYLVDKVIVELKDKDDQDISIGQLLGKHPELKPALERISNHDKYGEVFYKNIDKLSRSSQLTAIKQHDQMFSFLSPNKQTKEHVISYIHSFPKAADVSLIRNDLQTLPEVIQFAIETGQFGKLSPKVKNLVTPEQKQQLMKNRSHHGWETIDLIRTEDEAIDAIDHNIHALQSIDKKYQTEKVIDHWLDKNIERISTANMRSWNNIDDKFKTLERIKRAAMFIPELLSQIPKEKHSVKLFKSMIEKQDNRAFEEIMKVGNPQLITKDFIKDVFSASPDTMYGFFETLGHDPNENKDTILSAAKQTKKQQQFLRYTPTSLDLKSYNSVYKTLLKNLLNGTSNEWVTNFMRDYRKGDVPPPETLELVAKHKDRKDVLDLFGKPIYMFSLNRDPEFDKVFKSIQERTPEFKRLLDEFNQQMENKRNK